MKKTSGFGRQPNKELPGTSDSTLIEDIYAENKLDLKSLSILLQTIPVPIFYKDIFGRYLACNQAFEEFIGKSSEDIIGKTIYEIVPSDIAEIYEARDKELYKHSPETT
jgi:PAS domain-containing protein